MPHAGGSTWTTRCGLAQRLAAPKGLKADLRASSDISKYSGHWQATDSPREGGSSSAGDLYGWAGSAGLRSAIKTYHEDHRKLARKRFEDFASNFDAVVTERVAEPESGRDMQLR